MTKKNRDVFVLILDLKETLTLQKFSKDFKFSVNMNERIGESLELDLVTLENCPV